MAVAGFSHSDDRGLALALEKRANQVELVVSSVDLAAEHTLEPFPAQRLERLATGLALESRPSRSVEPRFGGCTVMARNGAEERDDHVFGTTVGRLLLTAAEAD